VQHEAQRLRHGNPCGKGVTGAGGGQRMKIQGMEGVRAGREVITAVRKRRGIKAQGWAVCVGLVVQGVSVAHGLKAQGSRGVRGGQGGWQGMRAQEATIGSSSKGATYRRSLPRLSTLPSALLPPGKSPPSPFPLLSLPPPSPLPRPLPRPPPSPPPLPALSCPFPPPAATSSAPSSPPSLAALSHAPRRPRAASRDP